MGNPYCTYVDLLGRDCPGTLRRQHSGHRGLLVCTHNKKHTFPVGSTLLRRHETKEEENITQEPVKMRKQLIGGRRR